MILSKKYLQKLIKINKAIELGIITEDDIRWMVVDRYDLQRVDHYIV